MSSSGRCVHANVKCQISNIVHAQGISWLLQKSGLFSLLMPQRLYCAVFHTAYIRIPQTISKMFQKFGSSHGMRIYRYRRVQQTGDSQHSYWVTNQSCAGRSDNAWFSLLVCRLCPLFGKHIDQSDDVDEGYRNVAYNWMRLNDIHNTQSRNKATQITECTSLIS